MYAGLTPAKIAALIAEETDSGEIVPATPDFSPTILRTPARAPEASGSVRRAEAHEVRPRPVMAVELPPLKLNPEQYQRVTSGKVPVQVEYPPVKVKGPSFVLRSRKSQELKDHATYHDRDVHDSMYLSLKSRAENMQGIGLLLDGENGPSSNCSADYLLLSNRSNVTSVSQLL